MDFIEGEILYFNKPLTWTSFDLVNKFRYKLCRKLKVKKIKVGHAGTLDPLATGVLLICVGKATKVSESLQAERKEYVADVAFGATTPSFDKEKEVDAVYPYEHITPEMIESALEGMLGEQMQLPPVYSAKYVDGIRAYEKARQGEEVELKAARIVIYGTKVLSYEPPVLRVAVQCSNALSISDFETFY